MTAGRPSGVILVTCEYPPFPGGIGTYAGSMARAVREAGYDVTVIAPAYPDRAEPEPDDETHRILGHHQIGPRAASRLLSILSRAPRNRIVLAADIRSVLALYILKPLHRRSYRVMVHGSEAAKFRGGSPLFRLVRRAYLGAELVLYNSHATAEIFRRGIGAPRRDEVTYLGVEPQWFEITGGAFEHPDLARLPLDAPLFCSVGRIEPRKGQLQTVRALARARDAFGLVNPIYVIAGRAEDSSYVAAVLEEAERLSIETIVAGRVGEADLKRLYVRSVCHCLCAQALPGKIEGFGLVLLEAAGQGCPTVATDVGGIPEVIADCGVIAAPDDLDAIARALAAFAQDRGLRERLGTASRVRARSFTWQSCAAGTFPELDRLTRQLASRSR